MSRYEVIFERLSNLPKTSLKKCTNKVCACTGCVGDIPERFIKMYLSGELERLIRSKK